MFSNYTDILEFKIFEQKFKKIIYENYPFLKDYQINCYTPEQYFQLKNVPILVFADNDVFGFSSNDKIRNSEGKFFAAIIVSPQMCKILDFSSENILGAIAHEIGHMVNLYNPLVQNAHISWKEIYADKFVKEIGLSSNLTTLLRKLKNSNFYSSEQNLLFEKRIEELIK